MEDSAWIFTLINLGMNGFFVYMLMSFVEKTGDPAYVEKVFSKTIWYRKNGNSKKSS